MCVFVGWRGCLLRIRFSLCGAEQKSTNARTEGTCLRSTFVSACLGNSACTVPYIVILSHCHIVILSYCHKDILSHGHTVTLSHCHIVILSYCHTVILLHNSYIPQMEQHEPEGRMLFCLGNVSKLLDVTPSNPSFPLWVKDLVAKQHPTTYM